MTASAKAFARYGPLAGVTLVCAALAGLGYFRAFTLLSGSVHKVSLVTVAVGMAIQGAATFPRKWESRLIIRPHVLAAGSLMLFAGAALLLVMLLAGCSPARAKLASRCRIDNFTVGNEQFRGARFTLAPLEALKRNRCRDDARDKADRPPLAAILGFRSLDRSRCALTTAPAQMRRAELTAALSRRQSKEREI